MLFKFEMHIEGDSDEGPFDLDITGTLPFELYEGLILEPLYPQEESEFICSVKVECVRWRMLPENDGYFEVIANVFDEGAPLKEFIRVFERAGCVIHEKTKGDKRPVSVL